MSLREALQAKYQPAVAMNYRLHSWGVYDEKALLLILDDWQPEPYYFELILQAREKCDKLVLALPEERLAALKPFLIQLECVDGLTGYEDPLVLARQIQDTELAFVGLPQPEEASLRDRCLNF